MKRMCVVYRSFLQGILVGLFFVVLLSPKIGQILPEKIRVVDQSVLVLVFSGILGGLLYTIMVDGHVELPKFTPGDDLVFQAGLFGDLLLGISGALVFEYLTTSLIITDASTPQQVIELQSAQLKLVAAQGIIGGYGGRAIMNLALRKFLNRVDKLEVEKRNVVEKHDKLAEENTQLRQHIEDLTEEKFVLESVIEEPSNILPKDSLETSNIATIQRVLEAEVDGAIPIQDWSSRLIQVVYVALIKLGFLEASDDLDKVADGWKIFKESVNQASPEMIGTGSAQALLGALRKLDESSHASPIANFDEASDSIPQQAIELIKEQEGFRAEAYADPGHGWDVPTIGYGTTKYLPDGRPVQKGDSITRSDAEQCLIYALENEFKTALESLPTWARMNSNQRSALYSFAYNLGKGFYQGDNFESITALCDNPDKWNDLAHVKSVFGKYKKSNGKVLDGLVKRRRAEAELFCKPASARNESNIGSRVVRNLNVLERRFINDPNPPLNVRSGPDTNHEKVDTLSNETRVAVIDRKNGWLKINAPVHGWISEKNTAKFLMKFISDANPPTNVRSGPGQSHNVVRTLDNGTSIKVVEEQDGWIHLVGPVDGWISKNLAVSASKGVSGSPAPSSMTDNEKYEHYRRLVEASRGTFRGGPNQRNLIGFRKETSTHANRGKGAYDDQLFMVWKSSSGQCQIRQYSYCTEPTSQYEADSEFSRKVMGVDADGDGRKDLGRIPHGYYEYKIWKGSNKYPQALRSTAEIMAERDTDHDGKFETHEPKASAGYSMLFHPGGKNNAFSAGCQTFHPNVFSRFWSDLHTNGNPGVIGYTLVDWKV